jgi:hypothetical protein
MVREPRGSGTSAIGSCYRAAVSEDVTVDTSVFVCVCVIVSCKV